MKGLNYPAGLPDTYTQNALVPLLAWKKPKKYASYHGIPLALAYFLYLIWILVCRPNTYRKISYPSGCTLVDSRL